MRKRLDLNKPSIEVIVDMSEGNPGAVNALTTLIKEEEEGPLTILFLDDMNIRGAQLWAAYKDYCEFSTSKLVEAARVRDQKMVDYLNNCGGVGDEVAVVEGASENHEP